MTDVEPAEPPRQVWHFALLVPFLFAIIVSEFASGRPAMVAPFNNVALVGPAPADLVPEVGGDWSVVIHRSDWSPPVAAALGHGRQRQAPRLGWIVREWSVLSLPLVAWRQSDLAAVTETGYGYSLAGLTPVQRAALDARGAVGWFPWWRYGWGWLVLALFAGFVHAEFRWQARRRTLLGIM